MHVFDSKMATAEGHSQVCGHGRRELKCPKGHWAVNWLAELDKHCRPEIAGQVKQLMEMLIHVRSSCMRAVECVSFFKLQPAAVCGVGGFALPVKVGVGDRLLAA